MTKADIEDFLDKVLFLYPITPKKIIIACLAVLVIFFAGRVSAHENTHSETRTVIVNHNIHHRINPGPYVVGGFGIGISIGYAWGAKKDEKIKIGVEARKPE